MDISVGIIEMKRVITHDRSRVRFLSRVYYNRHKNVNKTKKNIS